MKEVTPGNLDIYTCRGREVGSTFLAGQLAVIVANNDELRLFEGHRMARRAGDEVGQEISREGKEKVTGKDEG
ncbi:hypothetical protein E2C01_071494 [Portunus trituberculatus]|uniref:Uncharacterized protein n=1 Tax=Portunus trituberculatus TaxID=210409 RepID=A0A5B7I439_PORTR|nr:hypothetical protein [Portunus trituberculatus]